MEIGHMEVTDLTPHRTGRLLLENMYKARFGKPMPSVSLTKEGKPFFSDGHIHFSISHTRHHAFCVLADCPVGIDAEETDRDIRLKLAEKILSPGEFARWQAAPDPHAALLRLWVLKEAQAKCAGQGLRGYPNYTDFCPEDPRITTIHGCYVAVISEEHTCCLTPTHT